MPLIARASAFDRWALPMIKGAGSCQPYSRTVYAPAMTLLLPRPDGTSAQRGGIGRLKADRNVGSSDASRVLPALHTGANSPGPLLALSILAGLVAAVLLALQVWIAKPHNPGNDEFLYLTMARDLSQTGQFTNGIFADDPGAPQKPGRFFAPAYPVLVSLVSRLDPGLASWVSCHAAQPYVDTAVCPGSAQTLFAVQVLMAAVGMACIFSIALNLSGSPLVAWIAILMTLATGQPALYAKTYLSENPSFLAFYLFLACLVTAVTRRNHWMLGAAGASLALAALSRPSYLYLYYAVIAALALLALIRPPRNLGITWRATALFAGAGLAVLAPWLLRNFFVFGEPSPTSGYGGFILAQRLAYSKRKPNSAWIGRAPVARSVIRCPR